MSPRRPRRFCALLLPAGVHVAEYRRARAGLEVVRYSRDLTPSADEGEAAERLAQLLEAEGARDARLALATSGFGGHHHLLTLPPGPPEVLGAVVTREMRRFYPELFPAGEPEPLIAFAEVDSSGERQGGQQKELLVAGVPHALLERVREALAARRIVLEHWTILPRALQRLHDSFAGAFDTDATLLLVPQAPLAGFFHQGELRLFSEPLLGSTRPGGEAEALVEHFQRGTVFLRQQFRGAALERVWLAAEPDMDEAGIAARIERELEVPVERLGAPRTSAGALAALGAALDARAPDGLNLLPPALRPPTAPELWARALGVGSAALLVAAAAWWGGSGVRVERQAEERVERLEQALAERRAAFGEVETVVRERRAHAQRAALIAGVASERHFLPELLWPLQAAEPDVRVTELRLDPAEAGWKGTVVGVAGAESGTAAAAAVDQLYRDLSRTLAPGTVQLDSLAYAPPPADTAAGEPRGGAATEIAFRISFQLPQPTAPQP